MKCLKLLVAVTLFSSVALGQNGQLSGLVKDKTDAVVPSATLTLSNIDTGARLATKSGREGLYVFASVPSGRYSLSGEAAGFGKTVINDIKIDVAAYVSQDIVLQIQNASETVDVNSAPSQLAEATGAVSTVIDRPLIENMPLNGNSLQTLFELTPGVVINAGGSQANGGGFSVNGQRPTSNYLMVDGASENIYIPPASTYPGIMGTGIATSASGGTNGLLPLDAIEEFRIQTSSYSAEYGRTPGGQIEVKSRSGTNSFHGSAFDNFRNQVMDAQDYFIGYDNALYGSTLKQPPLRMNDFGGTLGGPILKNRLFFFIAHESLYMNQPQPASTTDVPDEQTRSNAASVFQPFLNSYPSGNGGPDPNRPGSDFYNYSYSNVIRDHSTSARVDANFPKGVHGFFRINDAPSDLTSPAFSVRSFLTKVDILTFTSGFTFKLPSNMLDEFTFNYSTNTGSYSFANVPKEFAQAISTLVDPSQTTAAFFATPWRQSLEIGPNTGSELTQYNLIDQFTLLLGRHTLHTGVDYRKIRPTVSQTPFLYMDTNFSANSLQSGTLDDVEYDAFVDQPNVEAHNASLYIVDDWKPTRYLTLNLGLRWEYNPAPAASGFGLLAMQGNPSNPSSIVLAPAHTALYKNRYNNYAPRLGFAYAVRDTARFRSVIRGGGGVFFDTGQAAVAAQAVSFSYPYHQQALLSSVPYSSLDINQLQLATFGLPQFSLTLTDPHLASPRTYQWSLTADQELGANTVVSTSYVGNVGEKLLKENTYQGLTPSLTTSSGHLYVYTNGEQSSYNALQVQLRNRTPKRVSVLASYTWAHALDNGSSDFLSVAGYQKNYRADSDNDIRHIFASAVHYSPEGIANSRLLKALTGGWSLEAIALLQTATPMSVYSSVNPSVNPNLYNSYADVVPGVKMVISNPAAPGGQQLNPLAFAPAPGTRDGTSQRNGYRLFGLTQFDLAISRRWSLWEGTTMTFRASAFNVLNHPNFATVDNYVGDPTFGQALATYAGTFGTNDATSGGLNQVFSNGGPRSLQIGLRINF